MKTPKILITICARGGSKGVKNKNIRPLLNKPLISHTIEQAKKWGKSNHILVSTDSQEIAKISKNNGAWAPFLRPSKLAQDTSAKIPVIAHAVDYAETHLNESFDLIIDLDPTAPLRQVSDIESCFSLFQQKKPLALFSVVKSHKNPYFNMIEKTQLGQAIICKSLPSNVTRRQDAPNVYDMNASIYIYDRQFFKDKTNTMPYSKNAIIYEMDPLSAFDIDREIDFQIVEFLLKQKLYQFDYLVN